MPAAAARAWPLRIMYPQAAGRLRRAFAAVRSCDEKLVGLAREEEKDVAAGRSVMISLVDCTLIIERDGQIRWVDSRVTKLLGYDATEVPGHHVWEVVHPDDMQRAADTLQRHLATPGFPEPTLIVRCRHVDGTWRRCEVPARTLDDGAIMLGVRYVGSQDASTLESDVVDPGTAGG
jgi:PAS domain S-box-containing protein